MTTKEQELNRLYFRSYYASNAASINARQKARWAKHKDSINAKRREKRLLAKQGENNELD